MLHKHTPQTHAPQLQYIPFPYTHTHTHSIVYYNIYTFGTCKIDYISYCIRNRRNRIDSWLTGTCPVLLLMLKCRVFSSVFDLMV